MNGRNGGRWLRMPACCTAAVAVVVLALCAPAPAQDHVTSRIMYLELDPGEDGVAQIIDEMEFSQEPTLVGDGMLSGADGDVAEAYGLVDLRTAEMGAYAAIENAPYPSGWSRAAASSRVEMRDKLFITTPPGDYPEGVDVLIPYTITGLLQAFLQDPGGAPVTGFALLAEVRLALGITTFQDIVDLVEAPGGRTVNTQGELRATIEPFSSFGEKVTEFDMSAYIQADAETAGIDPSPVLLSGVQLGVRYHHTVTLGPLQVPEGVTWMSESGMFQTGKPIPEPAGLGLIGLAMLAVRKRRS